MELKTNKLKIQELLDKNEITLKNLYYLDQDMGFLLDNTSTINYMDCNNLNINIESKINRIGFIKCSDICINLNGLISGIEIKNSTNININNGLKKNVNYIKIENSSNITIIISKKIHKDVYYEIDKSYNITIFDHHNKKLLY